MDSQAISPTLRELRQKQGLKLKEVAQKAGTSMAAVHRYENSWDRFELATLQKIVTALGASLDIKIIPGPKKSGKALPAKDLAKILRPLFWDSPLKTKTLWDSAAWVIKRVLEFGDTHQLRALMAFYSNKTVAKVFWQHEHEFTPKSRSAWSRFFKGMDLTCTSKSSKKEPVAFLSH